MASKIKSHIFYVAIAPYKVESVGDEFNELSVMADYNQYTHVFYVSLHAGWKTGWGHGCVILGDGSPLSSNIMVPVKESAKNSQKTISEMGAALELAKKDIAWLFNERMWPELRQLVKDVALNGYTAPIAKRMADLINGQGNESTNQKSEETMAKEMKAADLIGKKIVINGTDKYYKVLGVDGDKLLTEFHIGEGKDPMSVPLPMANLQGFLEKNVWSVDGEAPKAEPKSEDDVQEVENIEPTKPKAKEDGRGKNQRSTAEGKVKEDVKPTEKKAAPKGEKSKDKPKQQKTKPEVKATGKLTYETYTSSKGKQCARILGFGENDPAYVNAADIHGSHSWITTKEGRTLYVAFGPKYAAAAKLVCDALNAGKTFDDCKAIIEGTPKPKAAETKAEKTYTEAEVLDLINRVAAGDKDAMAVVDAMAKKAA